MRKYDNKIKAEVTNDICRLGMSTSETARRYNIPLKTVENWVTKYNKDNAVYTRSNEPEEVRLSVLEKENRRLRRDNEILKKTIFLISKKK